MQDDATVKQCKVMVALAKLIAKRDDDMREAYGFSKGEL
jgi:malyl-CoA/(S)-citramalyl-CoA lyase